jgi:hypothetical protein
VRREQLAVDGPHVDLDRVRAVGDCSGRRAQVVPRVMGDAGHVLVVALQATIETIGELGRDCAGREPRGLRVERRDHGEREKTQHRHDASKHEDQPRHAGKSDVTRAS